MDQIMGEHLSDLQFSPLDDAQTEILRQPFLRQLYKPLPAELHRTPDRNANEEGRNGFWTTKT